MGYDKFGLDWNVWGSQPSSGSGASNPLLDGVGSGWSSSPKKNSGEEETSDETKATGAVTARLRNAKFIPDETTDFNKPCKVQVEVESNQPVTSQVVINLWGKYKDEECNLQHEIKVHPENGVASGELKLYYVDAYYDDVASGVTGENVYYIAKCSLKGANPVDSEPLQLPLVEGVTLYFEDDEGNPIDNVKVTIASGKEFFSGEDGKVIIPGEADGSEVEVIKIEIGVAESESETVAGTEPVAGSDGESVGEQILPVGNVADIPTSEDSKNTVIYFKDNAGKVLANAKVVLSDGRSFVSDDNGEVSIPSSDDKGEELSITSIEMAEV